MQKVLGEQAAWRPEASAANPILPADPTGRIQCSAPRTALTEPLNIIRIVCEAKTCGGVGGPDSKLHNSDVIMLCCGFRALTVESC